MWWSFSLTGKAETELCLASHGKPVILGSSCRRGGAGEAAREGLLLLPLGSELLDSSASEVCAEPSMEQREEPGFSQAIECVGVMSRRDSVSLWRGVFTYARDCPPPGITPGIHAIVGS